MKSVLQIVIVLGSTFAPQIAAHCLAAPTEQTTAYERSLIASVPELLAAGTLDSKLEALRITHDLGPLAAETAPIIIPLLADNSEIPRDGPLRRIGSNLSKIAAAALTQMRDTAVDPLIAALQTTDPELRSAVLKLLSLKFQKNDRLQKSKREKVNLAVIESLPASDASTAQFGLRNIASCPEIVAVIGNNRQPSIRDQALARLQELHKSNRCRSRELMELLSHSDPKVRRFVIELDLRYFPHHDRLMDYKHTALNEPDPAIRHAALKMICSDFHPKLSPEMQANKSVREGLFDSDLVVSRSLVSCMSHAESLSKGFRRYLIHQLITGRKIPEDPEDIAARARDSTPQLYPPSSQPRNDSVICALLESLSTNSSYSPEEHAFIAAALRNPHIPVRQRALEAAEEEIKRSGPKPEDYLQIVIEILPDLDTDTSIRSVRILQLYLPDSAAAVEALKAMLDDSDLQLKLTAADVLARQQSNEIQQALQPHVEEFKKLATAKDLDLYDPDEREIQGSARSILRTMQSVDYYLRHKK